MAAAAEVRPQPPRTSPKVMGAFDPRFGHPVSCT